MGRVRNLAMLATAGVSIGVAGYVATHRDKLGSFEIPGFGSSTERTIEQIASGNADESISLDGFRDVIAEMQERGYAAVSLEEGGTLQEPSPIPFGTPINEVATTFLDTIIVEPDAPFMDYFYSQISPERAQYIIDNVDHIVFSPDIIERLGLYHRDVGGLSTGEGIIFVDTQADDGSVKNPLTYVMVIGHESAHEENHEGSRLQVEHYGFQIGSEFVRDQIQTIGDRVDNPDLLPAVLRLSDQQRDMAKYLLQFGDDFGGVYPNTHIVGSDLLEGRVSQDVLQYHRDNENVEGIFGVQLKISSTLALVYHDHGREEAIRRLYQFASGSHIDPEAEVHPDFDVPGFTMVSAASILEYLAPNAAGGTTAGIRDGLGYSVNFGTDVRRRDGQVGDTVRSGGYTVGNLPSVDQLIRDETHRETQERTGEPYQYQSRRAASCGNLEGVSRASDPAVQSIDRREGRPDNRFVRAVVQETHGGFEFGYIANCAVGTVDGEEVPAGVIKIDRYSPDARFLGANVGVTWSRHVGTEIMISPQDFSRYIQRPDR